VPTLIQGVGGAARAIEDKRAELAASPGDRRLSAADLETIRRLGDNTGCMSLKGAGPDHAGDQQPDRAGVSDRLTSAAQRWRIEPERDLVSRLAA
jgi:hypothetical protein